MKLPMRKYSLPVAIAAGALSAGSARGEVDFAKDIYPVLQERCIECHGPDKQKADLRLDSQEAAHEFAIVPGNVEESELFYRISLPADDDDIMPPKGDTLTAEQVAKFKEWIAAGGEYTEVEPDPVVFAKDIYPVLQERCIECHGPDKQKADLRLDSQEAAHEFSIVPGNVEESELFYRISLPADDDDIMPPKGDPLTSEQIADFRRWIEAGGEYTEPDPAVAEDEEPAIDFDAEIRPILDGLDPESRAKLLEWVASGGEVPAIEAREPELTPFEITEAEEQAIAAVKETGALAMRVAQDVDYAMANFRLVGEDITDESIQPLSDIKNLIDLDLSKTSITDEGLATISGLNNLTRLDLNNTAVTDDGLKHVAGLTNLVYLNLYGTAVTDAGLEHLKGLESLQKLFLWQSQVTKEGAESLKAELPWLDVNLGVELTEVAEEAPAEEEAEASEEAEEATEEAAEEAEPAEAEKEAAADAAPSAPAFSIADALLLISQADSSAAAADDAEASTRLPAVAQASLIVAAAPAVEFASAPAAEPVAANTVAQVLLKVADAPDAGSDAQPMSLEDALSFLSGAESE